MGELSYNRLVGFFPVLGIRVVDDPKIITPVLCIKDIAAYPYPVTCLDVYNPTYAEVYIAGIVICFAPGVVNQYGILELLDLYGRFADIETFMLLCKQLSVLVCPLDKCHQA